MDCKELRESLDLYVDQELSADATALAEQHLRECGACHRAGAELLRLRRSLKQAVSRHEPPPDLVRRVRLQSRPAWHRALFGMRQSRPPAVKEDPRQKPGRSFIGAITPIWRKRWALPLPVFAALLIALVTLASWATFRRAGAPPVSTEPVVRKAAPIISRGDGDHSELDLTRFDQGARAVILKIRRREGGGS